MKKMQQGFTLIELMIVVAIIGILAAIAIPAYQDYTKRAHVSEGLTLAAAAKTSLTEYYSTNGTFKASDGVQQFDNKTTPNAYGLAKDTDITGNAVKSVTATGSDASTALITITYNEKVKDGATVALTPTINNGSITWKCSAGSSTATMEAKWLPSNCR